MSDILHKVLDLILYPIKLLVHVLKIGVLKLEEIVGTL